MNAEFEERTRKAPQLYSALLEAPRRLVTDKWEKRAGIYVFLEKDIPIYVGRTRNVRQRMRAHTIPKHNSGSFAFKLLRKDLNLRATYKVAGSRLEIQEKYGEEFRGSVDRVKRMTVSFLEVTNPIDQYLLELYAAMELAKVNPAIDLQDFDTH